MLRIAADYESPATEPGAEGSWLVRGSWPALAEMQIRRANQVLQSGRHR